MAKWGWIMIALSMLCPLFRVPNENDDIKIKHKEKYNHENTKNPSQKKKKRKEKENTKREGMTNILKIVVEYV